MGSQVSVTKTADKKTTVLGFLVQTAAKEKSLASIDFPPEIETVEIACRCGYDSVQNEVLAIEKKLEEFQKESDEQARELQQKTPPLAKFLMEANKKLDDFKSENGQVAEKYKELLKYFC